MLETGLGIPYMGSKRQLAPKIVNKIMQDNPNTKFLYDLFGGGASVSLLAVQYPKLKNVFYNELNTGIVLLLKDIRVNGITDKYYEWIDRDTFMNNVKKDTLLGGICKCIWSFGNNQRGYLFGKDIENDKYLLHKIVVNQCEDSLKEFNNKFNVNINLDYEKCLFEYEESINDRRSRIRKQIRVKMPQRVDLEQLQHLERLEHLKRLQQLPKLKQLKITNLSYEQVEITTPINETIIYLDPPYKNTAGYNKTIDFNKLQEYIDSSPHKIYLSGYENTYKMIEVASYKHRSTLSSTHNNEVVEKLYCNR